MVMSFKKALQALNNLSAPPLNLRYALAGAVGAAFYTEATNTGALDVLVLPRDDRGSESEAQEAIDQVLMQQGAQAKAGALQLGNWPIQVRFPREDALIREAIVEAKQVDFEGTPAWVCTAEHLCALALQSGIHTGLLQVLMFIEERRVHRSGLIALLDRHKLHDRMRKVDRVLEAAAAQNRTPTVHYNAQAKAALRAELRAKSWPEKIEAIERMRARFGP